MNGLRLPSQNSFAQKSFRLRYFCKNTRTEMGPTLLTHCYLHHAGL